MTLLDELTRIAEVEFSAIVTGVQAIEPKRRIFLRDGSFVDMWVSVKFAERFGFHWERRHLDGTFFRYDNFPDPEWRRVASFPYHFHAGSHDQVVSPPFPPNIQEGFRAFMAFVTSRLGM